METAKRKVPLRQQEPRVQKVEPTLRVQKAKPQSKQKLEPQHKQKLEPQRKQKLKSIIYSDENEDEYEDWDEERF